MVKTGDRVKVVLKDETHEGVLMPESSNKSLVLKLDNGYNIGLDKTKVVKITKLAEKSKTSKKVAKVKHNKNLPLISILHTGGTIASKVDYETGAVVAKFTPEEILESYPELKYIANFNTVGVFNMQSESMRFEHYNLIAKAILAEIKRSNPKGIIITHGTDTLHYTAAALELILENLDRPVILVGSQRSSDRGSSDAYLNLYCAAKFIEKSEFEGIAICMHSSSSDESCDILPALKTRKMHTSRRDAFRAINTDIIASVNKEGHVHNHFTKKEVTGKLNAKFIDNKLKIGVLRSHTCLFPEDFLHYKNHDALIIEGTGLGHTQSKGFDDISKINDENKKAIEVLAKKMPVIMTSQCIFGRVNMNVYSPQRELQEIGVVSGSDMTTETAFIKIAWLLSNYDKKEVAKMINENLKGEINERISDYYY